MGFMPWCAKPDAIALCLFKNAKYSEIFTGTFTAFGLSPFRGAYHFLWRLIFIFLIFSRFEEHLEESLPNLENITLINNNIQELVRHLHFLQNFRWCFFKWQCRIYIKWNTQFIFLCDPQKSSVNVCLMKILTRTARKKEIVFL